LTKTQVTPLKYINMSFLPQLEFDAYFGVCRLLSQLNGYKLLRSEIFLGKRDPHRPAEDRWKTWLWSPFESAKKMYKHLPAFTSLILIYVGFVCDQFGST